jgi:hypothetical protein
MSEILTKSQYDKLLSACKMLEELMNELPDGFSMNQEVEDFLIASFRVEAGLENPYVPEVFKLPS